MIIAIDIETIPNPDAVSRLPEPEIKTGNIKDPAKIAAKLAEAKAAQMEDAALNPLTARVACCAVVGIKADGADSEFVRVMESATDEGEIAIIQDIMRVLGADEARLVTWNGIGFDLPMIYKRALILGVNPGNFGAPPLSAWTKRYAADRHFDLMQIWGGWKDYVKLDLVSGMVIGGKKQDVDVTKIAELITTEEGRATVAEYCLQDTRLTWQLFNRFSGVLFA